MTSPIDSIRRANYARRASRADADASEAADAKVVNLPVPVGKGVRPAPRAPSADNSSMFTAQMMGQDGAGRGLRSGALTPGTAKETYNRTEWSGAKDRRRGKGRHTRTEA